MLQKEFEERMGRSVTEQEYVEANAVYENAGEMDKDEFCREWLKTGGSSLVRCLSERVGQLEKALDNQKIMHQEAMEIISDAADAMLEIEQGLLGDAPDSLTSREKVAARRLDRKVWWLIGPKETVLRKIKKGMGLGEGECDYIAEHLK